MYYTSYTTKINLTVLIKYIYLCYIYIYIIINYLICE